MTTELEHWKFWAETQGIPLWQLKLWVEDPSRIYHCVFCGDHGSLSHFSVGNTDFIVCRRCREYKGIEPCIEDYCECWVLDVIRKLSNE